MKERLTELLKVKSIMTLVTMGVFVYGTVTELLPSELVSSVITAVITYYFTKTNKNNSALENE